MQVALVASCCCSNNNKPSIESILLNFHFHPLKYQPPSSANHWTETFQYFEVWTSANYKDTNISFTIEMLEQTEQTNSSPPDPSTPVNNPTNSSSNPTISSKSSSGFKKKSMSDQLIKNCKFKKETENKEEREWKKESREEKQATSTSSNLIRRFELVWLALTSSALLFFFANRNWNGFEDLWD